MERKKGREREGRMEEGRERQREREFLGTRNTKGNHNQSIKWAS